MPYLRNLIYLLLIVTSSPILFLRLWKQGKYRAGWSAKLLGKCLDDPTTIGPASGSTP